MALVIYWYDFICLGIVAAAILGSLIVLGRQEGVAKAAGSKYESLLLARVGCYKGSGRKGGYVGDDRLWMSCWRGMHPAWLLALRGVSVVVLIGMLAWDIKRYDSSIFVYYTEWTFTLVIVYFALGTMISAHGCWVYSKRCIENEERGAFLKEDAEECTTTIIFRSNESTETIKLQSLYEREEYERRAGFWGYLMQIVHQTCAGAVVLTDIVFWLIIVPFLSSEHFRLNLLMGCMHTLNALFLILDTSINRLSFPWFRLAYFVLWSCLYVIFQWILHACGFTWWPYPFLELATPSAPLWYFSLAVVHVPCYGLYALIVKSKQTLFSKLFPRAYVSSF